MTDHPVPSRSPTNDEPTSADLLAFGYAPGGYMVTCSDCRERYFDLDKRARRCRDCATLKYKARKDDPPAAVAPVPAQEREETRDDDDKMWKLDDLIADLQSVKERFGNTCVYIRRGGMSWGAVALHRRDDDKKHGVLDLQAQHDRDMQARVEQIERLIASKNEAWSRAATAEDALKAALTAPSPASMPDERHCFDPQADGAMICKHCARPYEDRVHIRATEAKHLALLAKLRTHTALKETSLDDPFDGIEKKLADERDRKAADLAKVRD